MKNLAATFVMIIIIINLGISQHTSSEIPHSAKEDGSAPDPSSMLDIQSDAKGVLIPRMTTVQRDAISNAAIGLLVFDTDSNSFWFYQGQNWTELGGSGGNVAWNTLTGIPADIADGDDVDDADADSSNEIQLISKTGNTVE